MTSTSLPGRTLSLPGPTTYTYNEVLDLISAMTYNPPSNSPTVPKSMALLATKLAQYAWWPLLSPDEVERRFLDDVKFGMGAWDPLHVTPPHLTTLPFTYPTTYPSTPR